jgi:deoxycytidine triphosphate deaminase/intein/homing endonuclease
MPWIVCVSVVLSDQSIREQLEGGGILIEPLGEGALQPSSVDLRVDRFFRVFRNDTTPYIDPKRPQEDLTELVEVKDGDAFILHPGEFVLGSTLERVALGEDLVARLEGKSSLGRLGLLIHSSLPASEPVMVYADGRLEPRPIADVVKGKLRGSVVSFDPDSFEVTYHEITGWYEGPADKTYEVRLASGRQVRVTAGHNLFTLDPDGHIVKLRTAELKAGVKVAIPRAIPPPPDSPSRISLLSLIPDNARGTLTCSGPTVAAWFEHQGDFLGRLLRDAGLKHVAYYRSRSCLPLSVADLVPGLLERLGPDDRIALRGSTGSVPAMFDVDAKLAWILGLYVAEGSRRKGQFTISNTDQGILDRVEAILRRFDLRQYRSKGAITGCSGLFSSLLGWLGTGEGAHSKRVPPMVFGWSNPLIGAFFEGLVDGDGSRTPERVSVWTCSDGLAADVLLLAERLGRRAGSHLRRRGSSQLWQIYLPNNEHKLLTSVPLPHRLLIEIRKQAGLDQASASHLAGYRHPTDLCNIEKRSGRDAVRVATLRRLRRAYSRRPDCPPSLSRLDRLIDGGLLWDEVVEVRDTGQTEPIFDLEVRPSGRKVENFLAGHGGVFVSNTAGFVDAGWDGHLTLELSNVANLPIAIYPGMKIGQISFLRMTTVASLPYGSEETRSKYQGQQGPTPSRYYLNFAEDDDEGDRET